ncbi:protein of unknown function [Salegentibacter holothuriorum]|uniref:DUF4159 domain-containing protein n=1 Tax=Salegentibacter holothuriorum TaxID=241145 RepID=A0A1T5ACX1_9FLAO|nr:DUF4159 domain-containing protein [Salegentibacter holothuriorum]SKB32824.1 protein of unknown function [Salegentibacter holothuriorum]
MSSFKKSVLIFFILGFSQLLVAQEIAVLKYNGGGDWYANPTSLPNLITFSNNNIGTSIKPKPIIVTPGSSDIFQYPFVYMTGHGNVIFNKEEAENLRNYLLSGGFLHIDDNYGMQQYLEKELEKIFPEKELEELPANHPIFSAAFKFPAGLPKIHEHDNKPPQALGIFNENRLVVLFTVESDLGDGWESPEVHKDPEEVRLKALKMGANILKYVFEN